MTTPPAAAFGRVPWMHVARCANQVAACAGTVDVKEYRDGALEFGFLQHGDLCVLV